MQREQDAEDRLAETNKILKQQVEMFTRSEAIWAQQLAEKDKEISRLQEVHLRQMEEVVKLRYQIEIKENQLAINLQNTSFIDKQELNRTKQELNELSQKCLKFQEENTKLKDLTNQLYSDNQTLSDYCKSLETSTKDLKEELTTAHSILSLLESELLTLKQQDQAQKKNEIPAAQTQILPPIPNLQELEEKIKSLETENENLAKDSLNKLEEIKALEERLKETERLGEEGKKGRERLTEEVLRLNGEVEKIKANIEERVSEQVKEKVFEAVRQKDYLLQQSEAKVQQLENELSESKKMAQEMELKSGYLTDVLKRNELSFEAEKKKLLEHARKEIQDIQKSNTNVQEHNKKLQSLREIIEVKEGELVQLATYCKTLQTELSALRPAAKRAKELELELAQFKTSAPNPNQWWSLGGDPTEEAPRRSAGLPSGVQIPPINLRKGLTRDSQGQL